MTIQFRVRGLKKRADASVKRGQKNTKRGGDLGVDDAAALQAALSPLSNSKGMEEWRTKNGI